VDDEAALTKYFGDAGRVVPRLEQGAVCFVASCQEQICAAVWLLPGPAWFSEDWDLTHYHVDVPARTAWSFDGKCTRWGAWGSLMARLPDQLRQLNIDEIYTAIDYNNGESLRSHFSLGYRSLGLVGRVTLLGLTLTCCRRWGKGWCRVPLQWNRVAFVRSLSSPGERRGCKQGFSLPDTRTMISCSRH
jgi:hypothetical protein